MITIFAREGASEALPIEDRVNYNKNSSTFSQSKVNFYFNSNYS